MRAADIGAFVPVEPQPAQGVEDGGVTLGAVTRGVGVLDAEHERPARMARVGPVEQGGADQADVWGACRRRTEPDPHWSAHHFPFRTTGLVNVPMPSMVMLTVSPCSIGPTPSGVPVRIRSPGSSVITADTHSMIAPMSWINSDVRLSWRTSPLTSVRSSRSDGSRSVTIHGPTGQNVSWPLARIHWPSCFC